MNNFTLSEKLAVFFMATKVIKADGVIHSAEKEYWAKLRAELNLSGLEYIQAQMMSESDAISTLSAMSHDKKVKAYNAVLGAAKADGYVDYNETNVLKSLRSSLNLSESSLGTTQTTSSISSLRSTPSASRVSSFASSKPADSIEMMYLGGSFRQDICYCSDNNCPCPQVPIRRGEGYIFVEDRGDGRFYANLTCEEGARLRQLDLQVAHQDAVRWWRDGMVPKRETPKSKVKLEHKRDEAGYAEMAEYAKWWRKVHGIE